MKLTSIVKNINVYESIGNMDIRIDGIHFDSRRIKENYIFCVVPEVPGVIKDRKEYINNAIQNGAKVLLVNEFILQYDIPQIKVKDLWKALAIISCIISGYPSNELNLIGITGTNGKTTTAHMIHGIFNFANEKSAVLGNLGLYMDGEIFEYEGNTPESPDLQQFFRKMVMSNIKYCIMEVSSHGLDLGRVLGCDFNTAVFTNLTRDHLDYHKSFEEYRAAKGLLFSRLGNDYKSDKLAILNLDDHSSNYFNKITSAPVITYGINSKADISAENIQLTSSGTEFTAKTFKGNIHIKLKSLGKFNVYNALAAIAIAISENIPLNTIKLGLEQLQNVRGRMEIVENSNNITVIIDYAHTPDGLINVLDSIKEFKGEDSKLITVFGCGGNRDREKRPLMGGISGEYSDYTIVTSDNPRFEDPEVIIKDIVEGIRVKTNHYESIVDRRKAIERAVEIASEGDVILIAGKGHEEYQIINGEKNPFNDLEIVNEFFEK